MRVMVYNNIILISNLYFYLFMLNIRLFIDINNNIYICSTKYNKQNVTKENQPYFYDPSHVITNLFKIRIIYMDYTLNNTVF